MLLLENTHSFHLRLGYERRALALADDLRREFDVGVIEVTTHGGRAGAMEVVAIRDGKSHVLHSKLKTSQCAVCETFLGGSFSLIRSLDGQALAWSLQICRRCWISFLFCFFVVFSLWFSRLNFSEMWFF